MNIGIRNIDIRSVVLLILLAAGLTGCSRLGPMLDPERSAAVADTATSAATTPSPELRSEDAVKRPQPRRPLDPVEAAVAAALANPARPDSDRVRDKARQSAAVLRFFGIAPGMTVLDLYSGGGYYTELLSYIVGPTGKVVAHNNTPYLRIAGKELASRYASGRLPNVERLLAENNELKLPPAAFDAILMIDVYHDVYHVDEKAGWQRIDGPKMLAMLFQALKPGGVLGVVDHAALPGAPPGTGDTLHRIDPALLKKDLTAAGFVPDGESAALVNPEDDRTKSAFDPSIRGRTSQVILRFRRPL